MATFVIGIPHCEMERARKQKGRKFHLVEERIRQKAKELGMVIEGDALHKISIKMRRGADTLNCVVTVPDESQHPPV